MKNLAPFCHLFCSREQFFLRDKPTQTYPIPSGARPPMQLCRAACTPHLTISLTRTALEQKHTGVSMKTWLEQLVTVGPLSKKDLPFSQICDKFHENVTIFDLT